ncbi:hypothetical protein ACI2L4_05345 [Streptomyces sparsogenes]|uniref:hypothetical protein n=1 Tax=Streptomyces sparsogenes TaxID=67365 RepID=UPI00340CBF37
MSAAPLAAAAGGLVLPSTARAAGSDFRVRMREHPLDSVSYTYPSAIAGLAGELPAAPLTEVLRDADRKAVANPPWPAHGKPSRLKYSFGWAPGSRDSVGPEWYPQGISTSYDAYRGPIPGTNRDREKRAVLVSWYAKDGNSWQGARITFVDVTAPSRPRYRHVLLVEPQKLLGRPYDFRPVKAHAGGIAWYGDRLYVADTEHGLRVFNINQMFRVDTSGPAGRFCGYHEADKKYYALGYQYVLPQSRAYDNVGAQLTYSQVAVDHTTPQPSLLVNEYAGGGSSRAIRWHMNPSTSSITSEEAVEERSFEVPKVQGVVSVNGAYYFSTNNDNRPGTPGILYRCPRGSFVPKKRGKLSFGPEDLSYDGDRDGLWTLGEHPNKRAVYVVGR